MASIKFSWTRYWYERDKPAPVTTDGLLYRGYAPLAQIQDIPGTESFQIGDLLQTPCLILLGEPGMGKSNVVEDLEADSVSKDSEVKYCFFDLGDYISLNEIISDVFERNSIFQEWITGSFNLHLFLDSLDEARVRIDRVANRLTRYMKQFSANLKRLSLRIVCRTSDWPVEFERQLKDLWGDDSVSAFILAPLQESDIVIAAKHSDLDAQRILEELRRIDALPFASRPVTLNFLLYEFHSANRLPETRRDLYMRGCLALCRELKPLHRQYDQLEPEQRLVVASRIAAIMVFTKHKAINASNGICQQL